MVCCRFIAFDSNLVALVGDCMQCAVLMCQTLSIFCGLGMHNCQLHKNRERLHLQLKVTLDALHFYSSANMADVENLYVRQICLQTVSDISVRFDKFSSLKVLLS